MILLEILGQILFWAVMLTGILVIPLGIPGTFLIAGSALVYAWFTNFSEITWKVLGVLFVIAVIAEALEFIIGAATASRFGASRRAMAGAIIGGIVGAIWATPLLPLVGTLLGAFGGAFVGAALFEYASSRDLAHALHVGVGAFLGSLGGKLTKIAAAAAMVVTVGVTGF